MSPMLALTLAASLVIPARAAPDSSPLARAALRTQMSALAAAQSPSQTTPADSRKEGAITGAVMGGGAMIWHASRTCEDSSCIPGVAFWKGIAAGLGALIGAGLDALFDK